MRAILDGIVVADFSRVLAGPLAAAALGDLGATVIKVESPAGDDTRAWGPPFIDGETSYFMSVNRNKRSIALDLKDPADRALARTLALKADVLVENFRPGVAERLGLGYDELSSLNPRLVYASITGFGPRGPGRDMPGYDFMVQALSGLMSITGEAQGQPMKVGVAIVDVLTGLNLHAGVLAALYDREHNGQGQRVDVTLMGSALAGLVNQASSWLTAGAEPRRDGNVHPSIAPYECLQAADGMIVLAVGNDAQFARCVAALGSPELGHDPRFSSNPQRVAHRGELRTALEAVLMTGPVTGWVATLTAAGVACGRVNTIPEAFAFSHQAGLPSTIGIARPDGTTVVQVASPVAYSSTPVRYRLPPPRLAEHDREIRQWLHDEHQFPFDAETAEGRVTA
jgi:crotonobetainyl-CoA:carnitine CoA-transferase CaiB-like acyl-CoA transferase